MPRSTFHPAGSTYGTSKSSGTPRTNGSNSGTNGANTPRHKSTQGINIHKYWTFAYIH